MKRLSLLTLIFSFLTLGASAQITDEVLDRRPQTTAPVAGDAVQQGNWLIGADIANIGHNFKAKTFTLDVNPYAGYFVSDNAAIGVQTQLGTTIYSGGESWRYGVAPFVRYYFPEGAAPTHRWFGEAIVGIAGSSEEDSEGDAILSRIYGLSAGYAHFVASHVALEAKLNYIRSNADVDVLGTRTGLSLSLGLQVYLPGRNR